MSQETKSACPSRQAFESAFRTDASLAERERLAEHALACAPCRARLNLLAGLAAEMRGLETYASTERGPRRDAFGILFRPLAALLIAAAMLLAALWLRRSPDVRASFRAGSAASLEMIAPSGELKEAPRVLCWSPYPGVDQYRIEIIDDNLEAVVPLMYVSSTAFVLPDTARRRIVTGRAYLWRLEAMDEDDLPVASDQKSFRIVPPVQSPN